TEFFNPPQPKITANSLRTQSGTTTDDNLSFGTMQMVPGKAFSIGTSDASVAVSKSWVTVQSRQFLIEEVPVDAVADDLLALPPATTSKLNPPLHVVSTERRLPPQRLAKSNSKGTFITRATPSNKGLVLDYQTISSTFTNFTYQADTTYYISAAVSSFGTNIFEGGTVVKFATNGSIYLHPGPPGLSPYLIWQGTAYRPVIFTAKDDNTVGDNFGSGTPMGYYGNPMLEFNGVSFSPLINGWRVSYAQTAFYSGGINVSFYNAQFVNCQYGINISAGNGFLRNALFANTLTNLLLGGVTFSAQNVTFSGSYNLVAGSPSINLGLTNCILANVTNTWGFYTLNGLDNGFYNSPTFGTSITTNTFYPFQTVGAGNYYLTNGCNFFNAGTTNIDPTLLASLAQKTTYPPIVYSNATLTTATTLSPQAQRDTDTPDLGYHYDPLDYAFGGTTANSNLTFTAGTAVGWFRTSSGWSFAGQGIHIGDTQRVLFSGTATQPAYWVRANTVQEGCNGNWDGGYGPGGITGWATSRSAAPTVELHFTHCYMMSSEANFFREDYGSNNGNPNSFAYINVNAFNSEFGSGSLGGYSVSAIYTNCLLERTYLGEYQGRPGGYVIARNCTMRGATFQVQRTWTNVLASVHDTVFDGTSMDTHDSYASDPTLSDYDYNAYTNGAQYTYPTGAHDVLVTGTFNWQSSWLGSFYLPPGSPLIDAGDTTADQVGLYHFTTQTNQTVEYNSTVDIGYHYVATDANGNPLDSNGNGIPDYLEDANGNGLVDPGERPFGITIETPQNGSVIY
ncbi:MAG TPA: hypothetical protein VHG89_12820, partial [Verrucomicrobiae bacterium]|nr:hypothetical protein [Verrucomicrobiae bacterium]